MLEETPKKCFRCKLGLNMPDGNAWCSVDYSSHFSGCDVNYIPGTAKTHTPIRIKVVKGEKILKVKPKKEVAPRKLVKRSGKIKPPQTRLF